MAERRIALAFDMDGVLANFAQGAIDLVNTEFDRDLCYEDWDSYGTVTKHPQAFSDIEWRWMWDNFLQAPRFWFNLEAFEPHAMRLLGELASYGEVLLYFTTKRHDLTGGPEHERDCRLLSKWWLNKYGISEAQAVIAGQQNRVQLLANLEVDYYLDDYAPQADEVMHSGAVKKCVYLINRPWNMNEPCDCPRVDTLDEYLSTVNPEVARLYRAIRTVDAQRTSARLLGAEQFIKYQSNPLEVVKSNLILPA